MQNTANTIPENVFPGKANFLDDDEENFDDMSRASACNTSSSSGHGIAVEELKRVNDFCDMPCPFFSLCLVQSVFPVCHRYLWCSAWNDYYESLFEFVRFVETSVFLVV